MHLLNNNESIVCMWFAIPEHNLTTRKDTVLASTVKLYENNLVANHSGQPEIQCLRLGIGWENIAQYQKTALLDAKVESQKAKLQLPDNLAGKYEFSVDAKNRKESFGYYQLKNDGIGTPVSIVDKITGNNQISIDTNNNIQTSSNLSGKKLKVKLPIYYPQVLIKRADIKFDRLDAVIAVKGETNFRAIQLISGKLNFKELENEEQLIFTDWQEYKSYVLLTRSVNINN